MNEDLLPGPPVDPDGARRLAEDVLDDPRLADDRNVVTRFFEWLISMIARAFEALGDLLSADGGILPIVIGVLLLVALVVQAIRSRREVMTESGSASTRTPVVVFGEEVSREDLSSRTETARRAQHWPEALVTHFRLIVATLIERAVLSDLPGRTTGEYRAEIADAWPEAAPTFDEASRAFERVFYGDHAAVEADVQAMIEREAVLLRRSEVVGARR